MITVSDVFNKMNERITSEKAKKINASFFFDIGGENGGKWLVDLTKDSDWVKECEDDVPAQCKVIVKDAENWIAIATGKMNPTMAFMQGKIKIKGSMSLAMKLQSLL